MTATAKTVDDATGLLALSQNGGEFAGYAARSLLNGISLKRGLTWETCYHMLRSAMGRGDLRGCQQYLLDWDTRTWPRGRTVAPAV